MGTFVQVMTSDMAKSIAKTVGTTFVGAIFAGIGKAVIKDNEESFLKIYKSLKKGE